MKEGGGRKGKGQERQAEEFQWKFLKLHGSLSICLNCTLNSVL